MAGRRQIPPLLPARVATHAEDGMPWHRVVTDDLVTFREAGPAIDSAGPSPETSTSTPAASSETPTARTTRSTPDRTPSGAAPMVFRCNWSCTPRSHDGMGSWQRHPGDTFGATAGYETADWRDPFVFWDADAALWRMLITARHVDGPARRRGVIAQCTSRDLRTWEPAEPFWNPRRYVAHECPEVFQWNGWWYLVYSEFSESFTTRYRMSRSLHGPWLVPEHDTLDGRAYYAAKSAARDGRRFFFGWIASREGSSDDGAWQWAGTLSVLEAVQRADGTLRFHPPREFADTFDQSRGGLPRGTRPQRPRRLRRSRSFRPRPPRRSGCRAIRHRAAHVGVRRPAARERRGRRRLCRSGSNRSAVVSCSIGGHDGARGPSSGRSPETYRSRSNSSAPLTSLPASTGWRSSSTATSASSRLMTPPC